LFFLVPVVLGGLSLLLIPWWSERGLRVAEWQLESGDAAGALATVDEYLRSQGGAESALALKARVLVKLGQPAEALRLIERVGAASVPEMRAYAEASLMLQRFAGFGAFGEGEAWGWRFVARAGCLQGSSGPL
jgi:hypothetical protein